MFRTARQIFVAFGVFGVEVVIAGTDIKVVGQLCRQLKLDPSQAGFVYVAGLIDAELPTRAGITDPFVGDQIFDVIMKVKNLGGYVVTEIFNTRFVAVRFFRFDVRLQ